MPLDKEYLKENLRHLLMKDHNLLILAALIGFLAGIASTVFRWMIHFVDAASSEQGLSLIGVSPALFPFILPLMPMLGGWIVGTICHFFPNAVKENGVHRVVHAVAMQGGKIRKRTMFSCATTSALTIGSGGSAGREGPTVQIGSAVGSSIGHLFHLSTERIQVLWDAAPPPESPPPSMLPWREFCSPWRSSSAISPFTRSAPSSSPPSSAP